jgi:DNA-binding NarL/FixJ family response regulator
MMANAQKMAEKNPPNITILFVDDDPLFIEILKVSMMALEYNVIYSYSAKEALSIMEKQSVHIVVTDIRMPEMNGFELLRIIKQKYPHTPVVALTSDDDLKNATEFMRQGGSNYLKKSSDHEELDMVLNSAIKHWSLLDELRLSNQTLEKKNKALKKTVLKQRETFFQLKKAKELAESAAQAKSELLAKLSHELRTPLHGISSYINFLQNDTCLNTGQKEKLDIIYQCSETMGTLIDNSLSKLENIPVTLEDQFQKDAVEASDAFEQDITQQIKMNLKDIQKIGISQSIKDLYFMIQEGDIESVKKWCVSMKNHDDKVYDAFARHIFQLVSTFQLSKIESILYQNFFKTSN